MDTCNVCGKPLTKANRFDVSHWCHDCVNQELDAQRHEDTDRIKPQVFNA